MIVIIIIIKNTFKNNNNKLSHLKINNPFKFYKKNINNRTIMDRICFCIGLKNNDYVKK